MRHIADTERRARLAIRHGVHPAYRRADPLDAARAMTVLHATESANVYLSVHARVDATTPGQIDHALYGSRSLVRQLAMRRTLFVFPRELLPAALGSASARVAAEQRRVIARDVEQQGVAANGQAWLESARRAVLRRLAGSEPLSARQLRDELPELSGVVTLNADKQYGGTYQLAPRVLTLLGAEGEIVRGPNAASWRTSRPTWTLMDQWLGEQLKPLATQEGYAALVANWLRTFGPGTTEDLQWWLGSTKRAVVAALQAVGAVEVSLDSGGTGWVLADDVEPVAPVGPWAALLPTLDPTTMGWKRRDFYLAPSDARYLFDINGNAGTTAWCNGRIVGAWVQDPDGVVRVVLSHGEHVGPAGQAALTAEAARLTAWLGGLVISSGYKSQLMKQVPLP